MSQYIKYAAGAVAAAGGTFAVGLRILGDPAKSVKPKRVRVRLDFCSSWSYLPKAQSVVWAIQEEFEDQTDKIYFKTNPAAGKTGEFEIFVNEELVHSKLNGDGLVDSRQKFQKIAKAIETNLADLS